MHKDFQPLPDPEEPSAYGEPSLPPPSAAPAAVPRSTRLVRWWFEAGRPEYWIVYGLLLVGTLGLFVLSKPPSVSPLIGSYLDLLDRRSAWAIPEIVAREGASFLLSRAFIVVLTFFLLVTFLLCRGSSVAPTKGEPGMMTRVFGLGNLARKSNGLIAAGVLYAVMLLSNWYLFVYFQQQMDAPEKELTGWAFRTTYVVAIVTRLFGVFLAIGALVQLFLEDFGGPIASFFRAYRSYFYPPLLAIAIVAFIFTQMDQFDGLFIDLVNSPGNFLLFTLFLFPASIIIIWFTPTYLLFTDRQFANRTDSWDILHRLHDPSKKYRFAPGIYAWTVLHKRLFPQLDRLSARAPEPDFMPNAVATPSYPTSSFHRFRAFLGVAYILTLISICANIYLGNMRDPWLSGGGVTLIVLLGVIVYIIAALHTTNSSHKEPVRVVRDYTKDRPRGDFGWFAALRERPRMKRRGDRLFMNRTDEVTYVANRWPFLMGLATIGVAFLLFLITLYHTARPNVAWEVTFAWFLTFLINSVFAFAWLALYQPFFYKHTYNQPDAPERFPDDNTLDRIDHLTTQAMLIFNVAVAALAFCFFTVGLWWEGFVPSAWVESVNPLNIYLLLINGVIAGVILLDRLLLLHDRNQAYRAAVSKTPVAERSKSRVATANFVWGLIIVGMLLAVNYLGNSYHEIRYHSYDWGTMEAPTLDQTVGRFLGDGGETGPVIFVASDGGGLKACYWTMLNLLELDKRGAYDDNVFALSGASGGTIGISMYNYLKARGKTPEEIRGYIERIGRRNYLSGDFAGLLTRFPLNYLPDLPGWEPHNLDDRMEGMARAYFDIVGDGDDGYDFDNMREQPYWKPWVDADKNGRKLPLLIINAARAEDGLLGTVVPLRKNPLVGTIDLSYNDGGRAVSYPDATFLSNRFPLASPSARITGKGHFVDAGNADNSGINSLYSLLRALKSREIAEKDRGVVGDYTRLFQRKIVVLSLRNAASRYVRDEFLSVLDSLNRYPYKSELSVISGAAINTGLTGVPTNWDDYLRDPVVRQLGLVDTFLTINLPFRLRRGDVYAALGGELKVYGLDARREALNDRIYDHLGPDYGMAVMPPLGRLLAEPILDYMDRMVTVPPIVAVDSLLAVGLAVERDTVKSDSLE